MIKNVRVAPSPMWLRQVLNAAGMRSINNIVDITNYVMLETGHPMHAFDLDKVRGRQIIVRTAQDGETLRTLDGKDHALTSADLLRLDARPLPENLPCAASSHDLEQLQKAQALGLDFVVLGPVKASHTHPDGTPIGFPGFAALREEVVLPIYALGGLGREDQATARTHGAQGVAAIRALWPD